MAVLIVAMALVVSGCGDAPLREPQAHAPLSDLEFQLVGVIGGAEATGPAALGSVAAGALILPLRQLALADAQTNQIHYFRLTGEFVRTVGGDGGGPGEYRAIHRLRALSDGGLCVWDLQEHRATRLDPAGRVLLTARANLKDTESLFPSLAGFDSDCFFVLRDQRPDMSLRGEPEGLRADTVRFVLFSSSGQPVDTVAALPGEQRWFRSHEGGWGRVSLINGRELFGFFHRGEFWIGESDSLRWVRHALDGAVLGRFELPTAVRSVSSAEIEVERARLVSEVKPRRILQRIGAPGLMEEFLKREREDILGTPALTSLPAYDQAVVGPDDVLWIREYPVPGATEVRWILLGSSELEGQLWLPRGTEVIDGAAGWLVVSSKDEFDAPVVHILRRTDGS